jgi:hypothetical protein
MMPRNNRSTYRTFCFAAVAVLAASVPALAHCGKCAVDGRTFADALKSGKVSLATATTLAEATTKGVAVRAAVHHHKDGNFVEVYCMVADTIMAVEVDCKTGMPGKPVEVSDLESHVSALAGEQDEADSEAGDDVSQADVRSHLDGILKADKVDKLANATDVQAKLDEVTKATKSGEFDRAETSLTQLEEMKNLSASLEGKIAAARKALDAARALSYATKDSPNLP